MHKENDLIAIYGCGFQLYQERQSVVLPCFSENAALPFMPDTWNHVPATPSTVAFLMLPDKRRYWASRSWTNKTEDPGPIKALAIVLVQSAAVTFTLQFISSTFH